MRISPGDVSLWFDASGPSNVALTYAVSVLVPAADRPTGRPTIHGGSEVLPSQSREMLRTRKPYTGCNAGITHFHADPHGKASICKVGRDPQVDLLAEGADGLRRLAAAADALLTRHGGCTGCTLHKTCGTCMPLASLYRQAQAPPEIFCQHGQHGRR